MRAVESEAELTFAALSDLLRPALAHLDEIPESQRAALAGALGLASPAPGDPFAIYAGVLSLLATVAERRPVLALVDDAHWLDGPSSRALAFVGRRMRAEAFVLMLAVRTGEAPQLEDGTLPQLSLRGLDSTSARLLLERELVRPLEPETVEQILEVAAGNPLALLEIPRAVVRDRLDDSWPVDAPIPVGERVERAFLTQVERLPSDTQRTLLLAAAAGAGDGIAVPTALAALGLSFGALEPAERAGLLDVVETEVSFRHPLVRSAVYQAASAPERRAAHRALADALDGMHWDERRAWHLAAATVGADESVAEALERAAESSRERRGYDLAAKALERAARLSAAPEQRVLRLLRSAEAWQLAGDPDRALALLQEAHQWTSQPQLRAAIEHLRGFVLTWSGAVGEARNALVGGARMLADDAPDRAGLMLLDAVWPACMAGDVRTALETAEEARALLTRAGQEANPLAWVAVAQARVLAGQRRSANSLLGELLPLLETIDPLSPEGRSVQAMGLALVWLEEYDAAERFLTRVIDSARRASAPMPLPFALAARAELAFRTGRWDAAYADASEAVRLADDVGLRSGHSWTLVTLARIEAARGQAESCAAHAAQALALVEAFGVGSIQTYARAALGLLELGKGRCDRAVDHLAPLVQLADQQHLEDPWVVPWAPDLVEAYVRCGRPRKAERVLELLERQARQTEGTWALAASARCRGLVEDVFEPAFEEALRLHASSRTPFEHARTELSLGERLRRAGRRVDARDPLRGALATFDRLGAEPWAERARTELAASGERARRGDRAGTSELTAHELQVALIVAEGATNREAAAALFVSPKTIDFHLRAIYRKLEIRSRTELARIVAKTSMGR